MTSIYSFVLSEVHQIWYERVFYNSSGFISLLWLSCLQPAPCPIYKSVEIVAKYATRKLSCRQIYLSFHFLATSYDQQIFICAFEGPTNLVRACIFAIHLVMYFCSGLVAFGLLPARLKSLSNGCKVHKKKIALAWNIFAIKLTFAPLAPLLSWLLELTSKTLTGVKESKHSDIYWVDAKPTTDWFSSISREFDPLGHY